jgi:hypothetical protein
LSGSQRIINVIRQAIEQETASGAKLHYTPGVVSDSGGAYTASVFVRVDDLVEDVVLPSGAYLNSGDYIIVGMTSDGQRAWVERILPRTMYSKMVFDYETASIGVGDGESSEYEWFELEEGASVNLDDGIVRPVGDSDISEAVDGVASGVYADAGHQHGVVQIHNQVYYRASGGDDLTALQSLVDTVPEGTYIHLPDDLYQLTGQLTIERSNIWLVGGGSAQLDYGGTSIRRITNSGNAVVQWTASDPPPYSSAYLQGGGMKNISIDANNLAAYGFHLRSVSRLIFDNVWSTNPTSASAYMNVFHDTIGGSYNNVAFCTFNNLFLYATGSAKGLHIDGQVSPQSNKCYALTFNDCYISHENGIGLHIDKSDDLEFRNLMVGKNGSGNSIDFGQYTSSIKFSGSAGVAGTIIGRASSVEQTRSTLFLGLGTEDHTGVPTIEKGARVRYVLDTARNTLAPDPRTYTILRDDFLTNQGGEYTWTGKSDGGAGTHAKVASESNHPGICELSTNSASGAAYALVLGEYGGGGVGTILAAEAFEATFIFNVPSITSVRHRVGLLQTGAEAGDSPSHGIYLEYIGGTDTNWMLVTKSGGSETRTSSGVAAATGWWRIALVRKSPTVVGLRIGNVINDNTQATSFTNIPTTLLNPAFVTKTNTASVKTMKADLFQLEIIGLER